MKRKTLIDQWPHIKVHTQWVTHPKCTITKFKQMREIKHIIQLPDK